MKYTLLSVTALQNYPPHSNALFKIMTFIMKLLIKIMKSDLERRYFWADRIYFLIALLWEPARGGERQGDGKEEDKGWCGSNGGGPRVYPGSPVLLMVAY